MSFSDTGQAPGHLEVVFLFLPELRSGARGETALRGCLAFLPALQAEVPTALLLDGFFKDVC